MKPSDAAWDDPRFTMLVSVRTAPCFSYVPKIDREARTVLLTDADHYAD